MWHTERTIGRQDGQGKGVAFSPFPVCSPVPLFLYLLALLLCIGFDVRAEIRRYVLGEDGRPWENSGTGEYVDFASRPGEIRPQWLSPEDNLSLTAIERGGKIWTTWPAVGGTKPENMIDGDPETAYALRITTHLRDWIRFPKSGRIFLDLGGAFKVERVRFRSPETLVARHRELQEGVLVLELGVNDGVPGSTGPRGQPISSFLRGGEVTPSSEVDWTFSPHLARYVVMNVDATRAGGFGIGELEVYGGGFVPHAVYVSDILDMGRLVVWGDIGWEGAAPEGARVLIRTRTGEDEDPNVYRRISDQGLTDLSESGTVLTRKEYEELPEYARGGITYDTEHWSFWSAPYPFERGQTDVPIASPSPRRYVQIKVEFENTPDAAGELNALWLQYSEPPCAHRVLGEVWPTHVEPGKLVRFTYAVRPEIGGDDTGFDALEVRTPAESRVLLVRRDGVEVPFDVARLSDRRGFVIRFRKVIVDRMPVEVEFETEVFRYGTEFKGWVYATDEEQVVQGVVPGNARTDLLGDDLSVRIALDRPLIRSVDAAPDPFTPNGDGINDETFISYDLLQLTARASVELEIYTLSGRHVRKVHSGSESSGRYTHLWDGRDDGGRVVAPGIYVYRVWVDADAGREERMGVVNAVY